MAKEIFEQFLHFLAGFALGWLHPFFSVAACLAREFIQNVGDDDNDAMDMLLDISVWTLGAFISSLVF